MALHNGAKKETGALCTAATWPENFAGQVAGSAEYQSSNTSRLACGGETPVRRSVRERQPFRIICSGAGPLLVTFPG